MKKAYINWSSGKDAAFSLYQIQKEKKLQVDKLVTTLNSDVDRISMHGVRTELLSRQAKSLQLPLHLIRLQGNVSMEEYNAVMTAEVGQLVKEGYTHSVFGDIFLEDLKKYRQEQLFKAGIEGVFPLWKLRTTELIKSFLAEGFKAISVCVNARVLDRSFCGRIIDEQFLSDLPEGIDPCGENGEFHTFVFDGPNFKEPIEFEPGAIVQKSYLPSKNNEENCFTDTTTTWDTSFWFCDLLPR